MTIPDELRERLLSTAFPCPTMGCAGTIHIDFDQECDDMGYVVTSWPVFQGECQDDDAFASQCTTDAEENGWAYRQNHGERLNATCEDRGDYDDAEVARLLGMYAERRTIAKLLRLVPR